MANSKPLDSYLEKCPFAVLTQATMRGVIASEFNEVFQEQRSQQYEKTVSFSDVATAVADVVLRLI